MLNIYVYIHLYNITFPVDWTLEYTLSVIFASKGKHEYTPSGVLSASTTHNTSNPGIRTQI